MSGDQPRPNPLKIFLVFIATVFIGSQTSSAQDSLAPRPGLFFELGGNGGVYSVNYQHPLWNFDQSRLCWTAGLSILPVPPRVVGDVPISLSWIAGKTQHKFELGTGQILILSTGGKGGTIRGFFRAGYRYEAKNGRSFFTATYTPFYSYLYNFQYENWGGIDYGFYFKRKK